MERLMRWAVRKNFIVLCAAGCLVSAEALAATSGTQQNPAASSGFFVAWAIAYLTRKRAIGGWLLYFYLQLYLSLLFSLIFLPQVITNLAPAEWDSALRYVLFVLSTVPVIVAEGLEAFAATRLLFSRNKENLYFLRKVLVVLVATSCVAVGIDMAYFPEAASLFPDVLTLIFSSIWTAYFFNAERVRLVFIDNAWIYAAPRVMTPPEKSYRKKRQALVGAVTFILLFLIMGAALGEKKPDFSIFVAPFINALIAATIAWYVPIRKKKFDELLHVQKTDAAETQS